MDYPLENLEDERFQQLIQALIVRDNPGVQCFPVGMPDGGRDVVQYGERLTDFIVYQVKFVRDPRAKEARDWIRKVVEGERDKIARLKSRGARQYIIVTNAMGTSHEDVGSMDLVAAEISEGVIGIPGMCWWRDDVCRRLDNAWDIKWKFADILTGVDFLRLFFESTMGDSWLERETTVRAFLAKQLDDDKEIKFKQVNLQNDLLRLFLELPVTFDDVRHKKDLAGEFANRTDRTYQFLRCINEHGLHMRTPATGAGIVDVLLADDSTEVLRSIVLEGAPGQGKSTVAQYVSQINRMRLLLLKEELQRVPKNHQTLPLRLPIKCDLRSFAAWLTNRPDGSTKSLELYLSTFIHQESGGLKFTVEDLSKISHETPLLVVLDGLDEVAELSLRREVVNKIAECRSRMRVSMPKSRLIVTSRPTALEGASSFDTSEFIYLTLRAIRPQQITVFADNWMEARSLSEVERIETRAVLKQKMDLRHMRELAKNPMQLTIVLNLIHERGPALADQRTAMYQQYVEYFFAREAEKSADVRDNIALLKEIHVFLGWALHSAAETPKNQGLASADQIIDLLTAYLIAEGHPTTFISVLFKAVKERVVMLVQRVEGTYEFEVQPLREYFAAQYLSETSQTSIAGKVRLGSKPDRFDAIALNSYWHNVLRFFCGFFNKSELFDLVDRIRELISSPTFGVTKISMSIGSMLLSDQVLTQRPRAVLQLEELMCKRGELLRLLAIAGEAGESSEALKSVIAESKMLGGALTNLFFENELGFDWQMRTCRLLANRAPFLESFMQALETSETEKVKALLRVAQACGTLQHLDKSALAQLIRPEWLSDNGMLRVLHRTGILQQAAIRKEDCDFGSIVLSDPAPITPENITPANIAASILRYMRAGSVSRYSPRMTTLVSELLLFQKLIAEVAAADSSEQCAPLVLRFMNQMGDDHNWRLMDAKPWSVFVDKFYSTISANHYVLRAAIGFVLSQARTSKPSHSARNLLDEDVSITRRLRFAASKKREVTWWMRMLESIGTAAESRLFLFAYWSFCDRTIHALFAAQIDVLLKSMESTEWDGLVHHVSEIGKMRDTRRSSTECSVPYQTKRGAMLMGMAFRRQFGQRALIEHQLSVNDFGAPVSPWAAFCQSQSLDSAINGALAWDKALSSIRAIYAVSSTSYSLGSMDQGKLPYDVAEDVVSTGTAYPLALWEAALNEVGLRAKRRVAPVTKVAKRDKWFA